MLVSDWLFVEIILHSDQEYGSILHYPVFHREKSRSEMVKFFGYKFSESEVDTDSTTDNLACKCRTFHQFQRLSATPIIGGDFQTPARRAHLSSSLILCTCSLQLSDNRLIQL